MVKGALGHLCGVPTVSTTQNKASRWLGCSDLRSDKWTSTLIEKRNLGGELEGGWWLTTPGVLGRVKHSNTPSFATALLPAMIISQLDHSLIPPHASTHHMCACTFTSLIPSPRDGFSLLSIPSLPRHAFHIITCSVKLMPELLSSSFVSHSPWIWLLQLMASTPFALCICLFQKVETMHLLCSSVIRVLLSTVLFQLH